MALTREQNIGFMNLVRPARSADGAVDATMGWLTFSVRFHRSTTPLVWRCPNNVEPASAKAELHAPDLSIWW